MGTIESPRSSSVHATDPAVAPAVLELIDIRKSYGAHDVLRGVSLEVHHGEMTALLGENGAGKSTLARAIAGSAPPDSGVVRLDGVPIAVPTPREARAHGIAFVPQELSNMPDLTVAENIVLGRAPSFRGLTSHRQILRRAAEEADSVGFDLPLDRRMGDVSVMQQQLVEVLKAFSSSPRLIILDEPTAALEAEDSRRLLEYTQRLTRRGVALVYISHRLDEVFAHCDSLHVLRGGELVMSSSTADVDRSRAVEAMLGQEAAGQRTPRVSSSVSERIVLRASNFAKPSHPVLDGIDVEVREGEVVGLYGLRGAGADTLAEAIVGMHADATGSVTIDGTTTRISSPRDAARAGIRHIPADRKSQGLVLGSTVMQSVSLPSLTSVATAGVIRRRREQNRSADLSGRARLRARSLQQVVAQLSGGNQQKVLLASRIGAEAKVLVLQEPTRGVDVGARAEIHELLRDLAAHGTALLVVSSDIEEVVQLCDRVLVLRGGRIVHEDRNPHHASQAEAITLAGGLTE